MKQSIQVKQLLCSACIVIGLLSGCLAEDAFQEQATASEAQVKITLQMPSSAPSTPSSYAISTIDENQVETIDVLAFQEDRSKPSGWAFAYQAEGTAITDLSVNNPNRAKKQFDVTLNQSNTRQQFVVLANVRTQLAALGTLVYKIDKEELLAQLTYTYTGNWNANNNLTENDPSKTFTPFPMWGEATCTLTSQTTQLPDIYMLRAVARVDIVLSDAVKAAGNFELNEIYLYNSKHTGRVVPAPQNMESATKVASVTLPGGDINNATPLFYPIPGTMKQAFERTIYLFEAAGALNSQASKATCVIIGGKYGNDTQPTYYRVDFEPGNSATATNYLDILRNHQYRLNITSVSGRGLPTDEDAFNAKTVNMLAEVTAWDNGSMGDVIFEGQYALSVSKTEFDFIRDEQTNKMSDEGNVLFVETNYDVAPNSGWKIEKIVDAADGTTPVTWLTTSVNAGAANNKTEVVLTFTRNSTNATRSANIVLTAGRLRYTVRVNQSNRPAFSLAVTDQTGNEISEMIFSDLPGTTTQPFTVSWSPETYNLEIENTRVGTTAFTALNLPASGSSIINSSTGSRTYTITPPALTSAEILTNPFIEKKSRLDFAISNGITTLQKSLLLRQINYTLIAVGADNAFSLDGATHSFTVKANTAWTATITRDDKGVVTNFPATSGIGNTIAGETVSFKLMDDLTNPTKFFASFDITFTSVDNKFSPKTYTILCYTATVQAASNSYMLTPGGIGVYIPVSRCNEAMDIGKQLGNTEDDVFTAELVWTDNSNRVAANSAVQLIRAIGVGNTGYVLVMPGSGEGNAVVAVKNAKSEILWSWHIWVTNYTPTSSVSGGFMDRNLGAIGKTPGGITTKGMLYQWGRKDPFPGSRINSGVSEPTLYGPGTSTFQINKVNSSGTVTNFNFIWAFRNPSTFYYFYNQFDPNGIHDWIGVGATEFQKHYLWGAVKTVYDPCPIGWRVPSFNGTTSPWDGVINLSWDDTNFGQTDNAGNFYPAAGYRVANSGYISSVSISGNYWSATPAGSSSYTLQFNSSQIYPSQPSYRANGNSVRCVKE